MEKPGRGVLTDQLKELSKKLLGKEISTTELRLIPYVSYTLQNSKKFNREALNDGEDAILNEWKKKKYLSKNRDGKWSCTKEFWDIMNEFIFLSYVDCK